MSTLPVCARANSQAVTKIRKLTSHFILAHPRTFKFTEVHSNNLLTIRVRFVKFRSKIDQTNNNKFCTISLCKPRIKRKETLKTAQNLTSQFTTLFNQYLKNWILLHRKYTGSPLRETVSFCTGNYSCFLIKRNVQMHCMNTNAEFSSVKTSETSKNTVRIKILITSNYELWHIINDIGPETTSFGICLLTRYHIPEDINLHQHHCETPNLALCCECYYELVCTYMEVISHSLFRERLIIAGSVWGNWI